MVNVSRARSIAAALFAGSVGVVACAQVTEDDGASSASEALIKEPTTGGGPSTGPTAPTGAPHVPPTSTAPIPTVVVTTSQPTPPWAQQCATTKYVVERPQVDGVASCGDLVSSTGRWLGTSLFGAGSPFCSYEWRPNSGVTTQDYATLQNAAVLVGKKPNIEAECDPMECGLDGGACDPVPSVLCDNHGGDAGACPAHGGAPTCEVCGVAINDTLFVVRPPNASPGMYSFQLPGGKGFSFNAPSSSQTFAVQLTPGVVKSGTTVSLYQ